MENGERKAMQTAAEAFNETFAHWRIQLPPADVAARRRGKIVQAGWAIWYLFGSDEKGEYLDYYAAHRMTNDRHVRLYETVEQEELPTISEWHRTSDDPEEAARLEAEYYAENRRVSKLLAERGFGPLGDDPVSVHINRQLHVNKLK